MKIELKEPTDTPSAQGDLPRTSSIELTKRHPIANVPFGGGGDGRDCSHNEQKCPTDSFTVSIQQECKRSVRDRMDCLTATMMNLRDEMILAICSRVDMVDVLYSFIGVNERLTRLVRDPIFTQ